MYRIDGTLSVSDFRIDGTLLELILGEGATDENRESLVVHHEGEHTDLALYIADDVIVRAQAFLHSAGAMTLPPNLDEFCVATEGVSHFVYFTFCGDRLDRPVSQIELELQAEIDKFLVLRVLLPVSGPHLMEKLFDQFRLMDRLSPVERERYTVANQAGRRYARWIDRQFRTGSGALALADARSLYRKPLAEKLDHIARAA